MKRIIASAGLLALGVSGTQAAAMDTGASADKAWSISATLRGFYDSNPALVNTGSQGSFGFDVRPAVGVNLNGQQTSFSANYAYTFRYFADRPTLGSSDKSSNDNTHEFNMSLMHAFTERYSVDMHDQFVYSDEPTLVNSAATATIRTDGTSYVNDGQFNFHAQATRLLEIVVGYRNLFFNYDDPGYAELLNRMEHYSNIDFRWQVTPQTVAVLGYQFKVVDYLKAAIPAGDPSMNNNYAHIVYVGADHNFSPNFMGSIRAGAQWTDYYNNSTAGSQLSPYVTASLRYTYRPNSYLEGGFQYHRSQTDANENGVYAYDADTAVLYATLSHSFTPQFVANLTGQAQNSRAYGPTGVNNETDWVYYLGLNLEYHFTPNFAANVGYNYDLVNSDIAARGYDRSRVFMGVTASY